MRSEEWWCAASNWKAARVLKWINAFSCCPTTVNRLPYNRLPGVLPVASHSAINSSRKSVLLHGSLSLKVPVYGYTVIR